MNTLQKFVDSLSQKDKVKVLEILDKLSSGDIIGLNIKKLSGKKDLYRVRKMQFRFIFVKEKGTFRLIGLSRKDDTTYNF